LILTSSQHCKVYKEQVDGLNAKERIIIQSGEQWRELAVSAEFSLVAIGVRCSHRGSVSLLYDEGTGDVWLIDIRRGIALSWTAQRGWMLLYPDTSACRHYNDPLVGWSSNGKEDPIAGWSSSSGNDILRVRLSDGRTTDIVVSAK
jgi:hypothetical protein